MGLLSPRRLCQPGQLSAHWQSLKLTLRASSALGASHGHEVMRPGPGPGLACLQVRADSELDSESRLLPEPPGDSRCALSGSGATVGLRLRPPASRNCRLLAVGRVPRGVECPWVVSK
jgi:hypothetical protein